MTFLWVSGRFSFFFSNLVDIIYFWGGLIGRLLVSLLSCVHTRAIFFCGEETDNTWDFMGFLCFLICLCLQVFK